MMLLPLGMLGTNEIILIVIGILILFGGSKIPQLMRGMGRGMSEFQEGVREGKKKFQDALDESKAEPTDGK